MYATVISRQHDAVHHAVSQTDANVRFFWDAKNTIKKIIRDGSVWKPVQVYVLQKQHILDVCLYNYIWTVIMTCTAFNGKARAAPDFSS